MGAENDSAEDGRRRCKITDHRLLNAELESGWSEVCGELQPLRQAKDGGWKTDGERNRRPWLGCERRAVEYASQSDGNGRLSADKALLNRTVDISLAP